MKRSRKLSDASARIGAVLETYGRGAKRRPPIAVITHERPDGDAIGSSIAFASILTSAGYRAVVVSEDALPRRFEFLSGRRRVVPLSRAGASLPLVFSLDATDPHRHGAVAELLTRAERTIVIDHHASNSYFGEFNWVDPKASAVGEMVYLLARSMSWRVPKDAAEALYVAIMTDTGRFMFSNTTESAFSVAGQLVAAGVKPSVVAENVYSGRPLGEWELEARLRSSLRMEAGGRIATVELTMDDFDQTGTTPAAAQDFASLSRTLEGVEIGMFLYEIEQGAKTKVGLRSSSRFDVNKLAARMGGGGHPRAAGCMIDGGIDEARPIVLAEAKRFLGLNGTTRPRRKT